MWKLVLDLETQWKGPVVGGNQAFICSQAKRGKNNRTN